MSRSLRFGPRVSKEIHAWARIFALEPALVEQAFSGYLEVVAASSGTPPSDSELAKGLSRLRRGVRNDIQDETRAPERADELADMARRLERSIARTTVLEDAGLTNELPALKPRLEAALALVDTLRAAVARRSKIPR